MDKTNLFDFTEKSVTYLLPILGLVGLALPLIIGQSNLSFLGLYLAVPMILAPMVYTKIQNKNVEENLFEPDNFMLLVIVYFICMAISIFLLFVSDVRPVSYYFIISVMATTLVLQIMETKITRTRGNIILLQIMMLTLNIIWGVTLNYHFYISRTDPIAHVWFIQNMIDYGHITDVFEVYRSFPLWHILCTFVYNITGGVLSVQKTMFFTNGIIYSFVPVTSYFIANKVTKNIKISLIIALFVSLYPEVISYGMASISRSVVSFLELLIIMMLLSKDSSIKTIIVIILTFVVILYHTASMPFILVVLIGIYIMQNIFDEGKNKKIVSSNYILLAIGMTLVYWMYNAQELFNALINLLTKTPSSGIITKSIIYTPLNELFNYLQYAPLLFFIIIGCLISLKSENTSSILKILCLIGLMVVAVTFPGPSLLINKLAGDLNLARFGEYVFLFICLAGGVGYYELYKRSKKYARIFVVLLFISMSFLSISNDFNSSDNPIVKRPFYTYYLTDGEIVTFRHIASFTSGYLMSDYVSYRYLHFSDYSETVHIMETSDGTNLLKSSDTDIILFRKAELEKRPLKIYTTSKNVFDYKPSWGNNLDYYYEDAKLWGSIKLYDKIYSSNNVEAFK